VLSGFRVRPINVAAKVAAAAVEALSLVQEADLVSTRMKRTIFTAK
jgi:hypothetical protein